MARTVRDLLEKHEADLIARLASLRAEIIPLERELAEVRRARSAVSLIDYGPEQPQLTFGANSDKEVEQRLETTRPDFSPRRSPYDRLTIKQLVLKALSEQFERGATAGELLEFFADAYGRHEIVRTSLSPQLSRLKLDGKIILIDQKWSLSTARNRDVETKSPASRKTATSQ
ncbi:hypothetical protein M2341_000739 [Sphingobium sp. B7D2B]|uniref:hypothetical protein n=1 Tax=Sphingobium sp. B7D2B TaxID=2940583 RepID=UPI00222521BA|nr:hypothetical protein [Sphingobium sp. B7D2B]MCW2365292.1 hypothetical protein [Sphingobium sp. B7D2B]